MKKLSNSQMANHTGGTAMVGIMVCTGVMVKLGTDFETALYLCALSEKYS